MLVDNRLVLVDFSVVADADVKISFEVVEKSCIVVEKIASGCDTSVVTIVLLGLGISDDNADIVELVVNCEFDPSVLSDSVLAMLLALKLADCGSVLAVVYKVDADDETWLVVD